MFKGDPMNTTNLWILSFNVSRERRVVGLFLERTGRHGRKTIFRTSDDASFMNEVFGEDLDPIVGNQLIRYWSRLISVGANMDEILRLIEPPFQVLSLGDVSQLLPNLNFSISFPSFHELLEETGSGSCLFTGQSTGKTKTALVAS